MQLQISAESEARYPVKLLGFLPDCSVMISTPTVGKGKFIFVKDQQMVTLRFVVNNVASGFSAKVLASRTTPRPYIHLEMPKQVQAVEVRSSARVNSELDITIINETQKSALSQAMLTNISAAGGRFECDQSIALIDDRVVMTLTLKLDDIEKLVSIEGVVRNKGEVESINGKASKEGEIAGKQGAEEEQEQVRYWYGFNFEFANDEESLLLKAYVYQEILKSLHML